MPGPSGSGLFFAEDAMPTMLQTLAMYWAVLTVATVIVVAIAALARCAGIHAVL